MFLLTAFSGYSTSVSTIKDTLVPVSPRFMRNALQAKDSLDIMIRERDSLLVLKSKYEQLDKKDSALIASLDKNVALADKLISNLQFQVANQQQQTSNERQINLNLQAIIRKKNWTIVKISGISVTVIGVLTYLLIKK